MEMPSFTEIKAVAVAIFDALIAFFNAVKDMFGGINYGFKGYETTAAEEENKPL